MSHPQPPADLARTIISSWDTAKPMLRNLSCWMVLLRLAAAGEDGLTLSEMRRTTVTRITPKILRAWAKARLIEIIVTGHLRGPGSGHYTRCIILPRGYRLLSLTNATVPA